MSKKTASSCERNQQVILDQLTRLLSARQGVLEIGSGTGQHAVYFAPHLAHLTWYTSDTVENHASIEAWMAEFPSQNLRPPFSFLFGEQAWPDLDIDAIYTANTTHIMPKEAAKLMMEMIAVNLPEGGIFCQYGPFNVNGEYTSEGNRDFDLHLAREGCGGIRDINELVAWGEGLTLIEKIPMPANNFLLVWQR